MVALCNRETIYIFILFLLLSSFFSSPNLSGRRLDVYHTLVYIHGVALVRIYLCFVYVFVCFYCSILFTRKVSNHLARVDVSAGNSLSTPQY